MGLSASIKSSRGKLGVKLRNFKPVEFVNFTNDQKVELHNGSREYNGPRNFNNKRKKEDDIEDEVSKTVTPPPRSTVQSELGKRFKDSKSDKNKMEKGLAFFA